LKVLLPRLAAFSGVERFLKEIQIARGYASHILALHDSARWRLPLLCLPIWDGGSLRSGSTGVPCV